MLKEILKLIRYIKEKTNSKVTIDIFSFTNEEIAIRIEQRISSKERKVYTKYFTYEEIEKIVDDSLLIEAICDSFNKNKIIR